jgi:regulator of protease activity HflC (stomatin/prohibitin superfamily)
MDILTIVVLLIVVIVLALIGAAGVVIIQPYEGGVVTVFGVPKTILQNGPHWVVPGITKVAKIDLREQVFDVPRQEVITKDNSPCNVDAVIYMKVLDPQKAIFEVQNFKVAIITLAQTTLRSKIGHMELDQILYDRHTINAQLQDELDKLTIENWGVKVERVEIREVDPVGPVKAAMEEQTAAERERRAQILRADGKKKAAILEAEGAKQSRILQAEGLRLSRILEAEGARVAKILETQGEAQALRILTMGAALLDDKALTIKSLETLSIMANGKATKIIFPFELSKLMEGASQFIGAGRETPKRTVMDYEELERRLGKADEVLGPIPSAGEMRAEIKEEIKVIEKQVEDVSNIQSHMGGSSRPGPDTYQSSDMFQAPTDVIRPPPEAQRQRQPATAPKRRPLPPSGP